MKSNSWVTHDMLFCLCGWEEDAFLPGSPSVAVSIRRHRKTCSRGITREQGRVFKY